MPRGGQGLQHPALRGVWCGREMKKRRRTVVLPEVNVVLSVAELSSRGCNYFRDCWKIKRNRDGANEGDRDRRKSRREKDG